MNDWYETGGFIGPTTDWQRYLQRDNDLRGGGTAINPDDCLHCFCQQGTGGNLKCCKCGSILIVEEIT